MLSRIFWVGIAGLALVTGMILQDGDRIFSWGDRHDVSARADRAVAVFADGGDRIRVVGPDMQEIDVPLEARRALADAVGRLVKAEADLAVVKVRDGSDAERQAAQLRRDQARTEVETLKAQIDRQEQASDANRDVIREQIREQIRSEIRDAVGN